MTEVIQVKSDEQHAVEGAGREDRRERYDSQAGPSRRDDRVREEIRIHEEEDVYTRNGRDPKYPRGDVNVDIRLREDKRYQDIAEDQHYRPARHEKRFETVTEGSRHRDSAPDRRFESVVHEQRFEGFGRHHEREQVHTGVKFDVDREHT